MTEFEILTGRKVGYGHPCFVIAEIGQNHQGDILIAKKLIEVAAECGADCVKFQKSDLKSRFNSAALQRPYISRNSWGSTYGKHRCHLEFSKEEFLELKNYANLLGIPFTSSGMDKQSIQFLQSLDIPFFKIGSGDANNFSLMSYAASLGKPIIVSTGMQEMNTVCQIYDSLLQVNQRLGILQCTSSYPTLPENVNLNVIKIYKEKFPKAVIGYSGHEVGIGISIAAVALGAKILERHITLCHDWKGSDHLASLEPHELKHLVSEIRNVEKALMSGEKTLQKCELDCHKKLAKTIVAAKPLLGGTILEESMLDVKVAEPKGWKAENISDLIGKRLKESVNEDCSILEENVV